MHIEGSGEREKEGDRPMKGKEEAFELIPLSPSS